MVLRTIPADVQAILERNGRRPQGWYKTHIIISLGTSDRAAAKAKCSAVASDVERHLKALRDGPRPLTAKQVSALSDFAYRALNEQLEANPPASPLMDGSTSRKPTRQQNGATPS
jgi:hypothetical protein